MSKSKFDTWYDNSVCLFEEKEGSYYDGANVAWDKQQEHIEYVIERLENYPTDMSVYLKQEESVAATGVKNKFIEILKEGLL